MNKMPFSSESVGEVSPEAFATLRAAYTRLEEKHKRAIVRWVSKSDPGMFKYWMERARLPGGYVKKKVEARELSYGQMLDKVLLEKDGKEFTIDVISAFLNSEEKNGLAGMEASLQPWKTQNELEQQVDAQIGRCTSPFAELAGAFLKCCPPELPAEEFKNVSARMEMEALLAQMDRHALKFEEWAERARRAVQLLPEEIAKEVEAANADADRLAKMLAQHAAEIAIVAESWENLDALKSLVEKVAEELESREKIERHRTFLKDLSDALRALQVSHRSSGERQRISNMRESAASEIDSACKEQNPAWSVKGPTQGVEWLAWAFALRDKELEEAQAALRADSYPNLAELVAHGDPTWIPKAIESPAPAPAAGAEAATTQEPQPLSAAPAIQPEPEREEPVVTSQVAPTRPAAPVSSPEAREALKSTPEASSSMIVPQPELPQPKVVSTDAQEPAQPPSPESASRKAPAAEAEIVPPAPTSELLISIEWDDANSAAIARRALDATDPAVRLKYVSQLAWRWLAEGETGLALHLVETTKGPNLSSVGIPPSWVLELLLLRGWIAADQYAVRLRVHELAEMHSDHPLPNSGTSEWRLAFRFLIAAAALRPVLLVPSPHIGTLLSHVCDGDDSPFWKVVRRLHSFAGENITPSPEVIQATLSHAEWDTRAEKLRSEVYHWRNVAKESKLSYAPATHMLAEWMKTGGFLHEILQHVGSTHPSSATALRSRLANLDVDDEIDRTQLSVLKKRTRIEGAARKALWRRAEEVLSFARRWLDLLEVKGSGYQSTVRNHLVHLRQTIDSYSDGVLQDLASISEAGGPESYAIRIAAKIASQEFQVIRSILRGEYWPRSGVVTLDHITGRDLLRLPDWDAAAGTESGFHSRLQLLLKRTAADRLSYAAAFQELCEHGRHHMTGPLLDAIRETGASAEEIDRLENLRSTSGEDWQKRLLDRLADVERRLNDAVGKGLMQAADFGYHLNTIQRHMEELKNPGSAEEINFERIKEDLSSVDVSLDSARDQEVQKVKDRLKEVALADHPTVARIEQIIASGDVFLANDYIERAATGNSLPPAAELETHSCFLEFFGDGRGSAGSYDALLELLSKKPFPAAEVVRKVREGEPIQELGTGQEKRAADPDYADVLQSWFEVEQRKLVRGGEVLIPRILRGLGFRFENFSIANVRPAGARFNMECKDELPCPLPQFGSETRGRYVVICVTQFQGVEQLLSQIDIPAGDTRGILILLFDKLSRKDRIDLGQACQRHSRNVLVLDDVLMVNMIGAGDGRLAMAFECALPFTNAMPYCPQANPLPREMFYGRRREIEAILSGSAAGSCFVYGGRQIGKTVLLTEVQRRFHKPSEGRFARHIDLKVKQIGIQRQPSEIWDLLAKELKACGPDPIGEALPKKVITYDWIASRITQWLKAKPEGRILMLLDEADAFLESDGSSNPTFAECDKLRDLMKATELRFKAVLAGLHNVQRATRVSNQPLVYFGEPLCIGPLIANGETRRAYELVCKPLASLGVYFENQDLPNSILARTNYYPNLIQIYCQTLLNHVRNRWSCIGSSRGAPYYVTATDLDEVYERQELRQELRNKFKLSLDLDRRFRLIANVLAENWKKYPEGMEVPDIQAYVMDWWPAGFQEGGQDERPMPYDLFRHLLDEMVGLGILRLSKDERLYSLRSPNVLVLLGTPTEIVEDICASPGWERPPVYAASTFHSHITDSDPCRRNPLSAEQEASITEDRCTAHIVLGSRAAGLDSLAEGLRSSPRGHAYVTVAAYSEADFLQSLRKHSRDRESGKTLLLVPSSLAWSASWVEKGRQYLPRLTRDNAYVGIVFECNPAKLWNLRGTWRNIESLVPDVQTLHPWHDDAVRNWLADSPYGAQDPDTRKRIRAVTGNWFHLLMALRGLYKKGAGLGRILDDIENLGGGWIGTTQAIDLFGISDAAPRALLEFIVKNPDVTAEDISTYCDEGSSLRDRAVVREGLWWAEKLDFIYPSGAGWKADDFLCRLLKPSRGDGDDV